jgi:hypothetical protein
MAMLPVPPSELFESITSVISAPMDVLPLYVLATPPFAAVASELICPAELAV